MPIRTRLRRYSAQPHIHVTRPPYAVVLSSDFSSCHISVSHCCDTGFFPVPFFCDSTAANAMAKSYTMTKSVKHLDIATNQCRDFVAAHIFDVRHIQDPSADMSTKVSKSRPDHIRKCGAFIDCNSSQSDSWKTWTEFIKQNSHQLKKYST